MRWLTAALGVCLVLVGGVATYDFFVPRTDRIGPDLGLWASGVLTAGLLLLWGTRLWVRRPSREELQRLGKRIGIGGLCLAVVPVAFGMALDTWMGFEGYATLIAMFLFGQLAVGLVVFSILILIIGGAFS